MIPMKQGIAVLFSCKDFINFLTSNSLLTLFWLYNCLFTQTLNKVKTHICRSQRFCQPDALFPSAVRYAPASPSHLCPASASQESADLLDCLGCCKTGRNISLRRMILNQVHDRMNTAVYCTVMVTLITEILTQRMFLIFRYM